MKGIEDDFIKHFFAHTRWLGCKTVFEKNHMHAVMKFLNGTSSWRVSLHHYDFHRTPITIPVGLYCLENHTCLFFTTAFQPPTPALLQYNHLSKFLLFKSYHIPLKPQAMPYKFYLSGLSLDKCMSNTYSNKELKYRMYIWMVFPISHLAT